LLINPDNPSGNFIKKEELFLLMDWTKQNNINFVLDESFVDFSTGFENNSLLSNSILSENQHLIIIKSISKSYGVPGLRLGIIASSNESIIHYIKQDVAIWNINSFAEFYLQIFGKYESEFLNSCKKFTEERERFYESLLTIKSLRVIPSQANYFLCEVLTPFNSTDLTRRLLCHFNILIKDCRNKSGFNNQNYVRIAIRSQEDNLKLYNALIVICHEGY
jgi:histidinol-phosphate/aromatic aminotransferase/cobyric acid decarboxylase-like protein